MFEWEKMGRVFNPTEISDKDWLKEFAQAPATLIFDDFLRIYFACRPSRDEKTGQYVSYTAYVDVDKKNFLNIIRFAEKPVFDLGLPGTFDEFGTYPTSVLRHDGKVVAYFGGWTRMSSVPFTVGIGVAHSYDDGKTFEKLGKGGPVIPYTPDEPFIISGPKIRRFNNKWYLFYIAGKKWVLDNGIPEPVYRIRLATSDDGINWTKMGKDLIETRIEENEAQASPDVIYWNGKYHMFFCYRHSTNYRNNNRGYKIGYAHSDDLINWTRNDNCAGISVSSDGDFDNESIAYPHVFELDGNLHMLYLGNQVGRFGFGWARLENYNL
ncbi:MAG: glycosyl hydrolase family protein [Bacteroidetes bacterium]|jgi:sucrose-6-phosphate hydrolase SacC (GH32 family)|nr:glycosyl hydrolase family protein [Bacteroidota bacterium]